MDRIVVIISGVGLIGLIYWFFFGRKLSVVVGTNAQGKVNILVDGGYRPSAIKIEKGITTKLIFRRTDPNTCLEEIYIPDFKVNKFLPLNQEVEIDLTPKKEGAYQTHCGMGMFHGSIIVE